LIIIMLTTEFNGQWKRANKIESVF